MNRSREVTRCSVAIGCTRLIIGAFAVGGLSLASGAAHAAGDPIQGAREFRGCLACHSVEPNENLTGPSLDSLFGRKAGSMPSFHRYSDALRKSGIVWNEKTLDAWMRNPAALVPGNEMQFQGIADAAVRGNIIAFLKDASEGKGRSAAFQGGMNSRGRLPNLKQAPPDAQVTSIRYCGDSYFVRTKSSRLAKFWEFNLRFKSDASKNGPRKGEPVLVPQGMQGDRAQIVFSSPTEVASFIKAECSP